MRRWSVIGAIGLPPSPGHGRERGADSAAPLPGTNRSAVKQTGATSGRADRWTLVACGDLVEGRVRNLVRLNLRCSLHYLRQARQHLRIDVAVIVVRVLFPIPQTDRNRFGAVRGEERNLVLETMLLPKQGQDVLLERPGKLTGRVGLQMQRHIACVHVDSLRDLRDSDGVSVGVTTSIISTSRPCRRRPASGASCRSPSSAPPRTRW